jgi:hypothetical protein
MGSKRRLFKAAAFAAAGAASAYLLDPVNGRSRRNKAKEQLDAVRRRQQGETGPKVDFTEGQ